MDLAASNRVILVQMASGTIERMINLVLGAQTIGRHEGNSIVISDTSVSGFHCELSVSHDHITVKDLHSINGTFVEDQRVELAVICPAQRLRLDTVEFERKR
jgi:adenylate cyclase